MLEMLGSRQKDLLVLLLKHKVGLTADDIAEQLGISRNAVRQHLAALENERLLFAGDHLMDGTTVVIAPPDGDMAAYLNSLAKLLVRDDATYLPTHGPAIADPKSFVRAFIEHRRERLLQPGGEHLLVGWYG